MQQHRPVVLAILDGWGESDQQMGNPVKMANLPTIKQLNEHYPKTLCQASGLSVGLPQDICGNSEVGHQAMGTGQIIFQDLPVISLAIRNGSFFQNEVLLEAIQKANKNGKKIHLMGLISDGGVHSHVEHLLALLEMAKEQKAEKVFLHLFSDGRDAPQKSLEKFLKQTEAKTAELGLGEIATVMGRYYAMDRNNNWERTEKAFWALILGEGISIKKENLSAEIQKQYEKEVTDEFLLPMVMVDETGQPTGKIEEEDLVIFFNFRKDRARQISAVLIADGTKNFSQKLLAPKIDLVAFADYDEKLNLKTAFVFPEVTAYLGQDLADAGKKQLRIAETEKYAHVTYFFNGGKETPFPNEERILIESKKVALYDQAPEMSANEITERLLQEIESDQFDFILVNFANPDMVGHTGNLQSAIKALETTDACLGRLMEKVLQKDGCLLVTADHGNVEEMVDLKNGEVDTEHSLNPVPFWLVSKKDFIPEKKEEDIFEIGGMIVDIPVTILELLSIKKNPKMNGISLLETLRT